MSTKKVFVTGIGIVSPIGLNLIKNWKSLISGKSHIIKLSDDFSHLPCKIASVVDNEDFEVLLSNLNPREKKSTSRNGVFLINSVNEAISDCKINLENVDKFKCGVSIGIGFDGSSNNKMIKDGKLVYNSIGPYALTQSLGNMPAAHISVRYGLKGACRSVNTACAAGLHAIGDGFKMIRSGECDLVIAGGTEACINQWSIAAFSRIRALPTDDNALSRPFDNKRMGFIMSEGAAALILQSELTPDQIKAGCKPLAELVGFGQSCDGIGLVAPDENGKGAEASMRMALLDAMLDSSAIDYVNAHATSTPLGDVLECNAIEKIFHSNNPYVGSMKGQLCHSLGAAGALETVLTVEAIRQGILPPNGNLNEPDTRIKVNLIPSIEESGKPILWSNTSKPRIALKNSFGFGGTNASLVIKQVL